MKQQTRTVCETPVRSSRRAAMAPSVLSSGGSAGIERFRRTARQHRDRRQVGRNRTRLRHMLQRQFAMRAVGALR